jgi:hypothetical protein
MVNLFRAVEKFTHGHSQMSQRSDTCYLNPLIVSDPLEASLVFHMALRI